MNWKEHRKKLIKNPAVAKELENNEVEYQIARSIIKARIAKGLTQEELAKRLNTRQSVVSRVENANTVPSISLLKRFAEALEANLSVNFA